MTTGDSAEPVTLRVTDRLELHELAARYGNVVDDRAWGRLAEVFTEDARFVLSGFEDDDRSFEGLAEIVAMMRSSRHPVAHHVTNVEVEQHEAAVRMRSKILGTGARGRAGSADYRDLLVCTSDGWRISERRVTLRRAGGR